MIRNVVMMKLTPDHDATVLDGLIRRLQGLGCPGTLSYTIGLDAGLREGNWTLAIVADFRDIESYRGYDNDEEHNRLRAELAPLILEVARIQFEL